ncbi:hypothetical protein J5X98_19970 [Leptothermofonsia sichuanensis E412]|uniref:hypothetical protein n=1 Tax=Leptothermofonsia sichuanensis TaxID=2917832 RepID=UPI001CA7B5F7|nr:hypothetical protein [Leptothermofonsia sichuanensis]QZZ19599.1 hypothetical protein J5X98_19970 [Leptothermofonsia sichuanensis E412]
MTQDPPSPDLPEQEPQGEPDTPPDHSEPSEFSETTSELSESLELPEAPAELSQPLESELSQTPAERSKTLPDRSEILSETTPSAETLESVVSDLADTASEVAETLPETLESVVSDLADTASEVAETLPETLESVVSDLADTASEVAETLPETLEGALPEPSDALPIAEVSQAEAVPPPASEVSPVTEPSITQTLQEYWERARPVIQAQTIRALRAISQVLQGAAARLESKSEQGTDLPATPGAVPGSSTPESPTSESPTPDLPASGKSATSSSVEELWQKVRPAWEQFQVWWAKLLVWVRSRLPEDWNEKLSDRVLSAAIAGILLLLLWISSGIFSGKPKPASVAIAPSPPSTSPVNPPTSPQVKARRPELPGLTKPSGEQPVAQKPAVRVSPAPTVKPSPPLKLTPEQKLIAQIQDQVAEITNQYVNGLIQAVQANFRSSRLIVKVGNGWYGLSQPQQNKLANEMLGRARQLNFSKLEITDPEGVLLARSPVVGPEMIILKRQIEPQETA